PAPHERGLSGTQPSPSGGRRGCGAPEPGRPFSRRVPMKAVRWFCAAALVAVLAAPAARAQDFPKPGPEHELLKKHVGTWDLTMKFGGMETKGTVTYKMELGGLWLASTLQSEFAGMKFEGRGMDSYDAGRK